VSSGQLRSVREAVIMMNGDTTMCAHVCKIAISVHGSDLTLSCLVANLLPGYDMLLGMDAVRQLGGAHISADGDCIFGGTTFAESAVDANAQTRVVAAYPAPASSCIATDLRVDDEDFCATFADGHWTVRWKWVNGVSTRS